MAAIGKSNDIHKHDTSTDTHSYIIMPNIIVDVSLTKPCQGAAERFQADLEYDYRDCDSQCESDYGKFEMSFVKRSNKNSDNFDLATALDMLHLKQGNLGEVVLHKLPSQAQYNTLAPSFAEAKLLTLYDPMVSIFTHNPAHDQALEIHEARHVRGVHVGDFTTEVFLSGKSLRKLYPPRVESKLSKLIVAYCPELLCPNMTCFKMLTDIRLQGTGMEASSLTQLRGVLQRLSLYAVSSEEVVLDNYVALKELIVVHCPGLANVLMDGCSALEFLQIWDSPKLQTLQCGTHGREGKKYNFVEGMPSLINLMCDDALLLDVKISCLPSLVRASFARCGLKDASFDGPTCPCLTHLDVTCNNLQDTSIVGEFPVLETFYGSANNFTSVSTTCKLMPKLVVAMLVDRQRLGYDWQWPAAV